ncbi:calcium release-activated calcium channel protein 1-like [Schistocerca nitens]|uniref:calcium release-activated calcium channel protein 1-like n=1 Tax=Schistocerca nitens TaxID=7011 RepID=UPI002119888F|nr:calcium release-activated calcium channel protein 1-like [Schistocerca nitens]
MEDGVRRRKPGADEVLGRLVLLQSLESERGRLELRQLHRTRSRLRASSSASIILCAFAMQSMVELQVNVPTRCPAWLFTMFAVCTVALVAVHTATLVISTFLMPDLHVPHHRVTHPLVVRLLTPALRRLIEIAWGCSSVAGLFLFMVEIVLLNWVKFWDYTLTACWAGTIAMMPFMIAFVAFCIYFHRSFLEHGYQFHQKQIVAIHKQYEKMLCEV